MGNILPLEEGETGPGGFSAAHGVAHRIAAQDLASLTTMEHEYRCKLRCLTPPTFPSITPCLWYHTHTSILGINHNHNLVIIWHKSGHNLAKSQAQRLRVYLTILP
jgi:hypothetical protein